MVETFSASCAYHLNWLFHINHSLIIWSFISSQDAGRGDCTVDITATQRSLPLYLKSIGDDQKIGLVHGLNFFRVLFMKTPTLSAIITAMMILQLPRVINLSLVPRCGPHVRPFSTDPIPTLILLLFQGGRILPKRSTS